MCGGGDPCGDQGNLTRFLLTNSGVLAKSAPGRPSEPGTPADLTRFPSTSSETRAKGTPGHTKSRGPCGKIEGTLMRGGGGPLRRSGGLTRFLPTNSGVLAKSTPGRPPEPGTPAENSGTLREMLDASS